MSQRLKPKSPNRGQRHSAAWGKRLKMLVLLLVAEAAFAQDWTAISRPAGKFASDLAPAVEKAHQGTAAANETVRVIVQYRQSPQAEQEGRVQRLGARLNHRLGVVKGIALTIPVNALTALEADPEILSVSVDHPVKAMDDYTNSAMNVSAAWNAGYNGGGTGGSSSAGTSVSTAMSTSVSTYTGSGAAVGVAVIDSGINDNHPDLWDSTESYSRVVYHQDFTGTTVRNASGKVVYDLYGHGTHVAGIVGGNGYLSNGRYPGVAPGVNMIDLRVLNALGAGSDSEVIAAIQETINLQNKYNIRIINLSLGRGISVGYAQDPLCQAVESAWKSGIVVVAAAGNYGRITVEGSAGYGTVAAPGNDPLVLTVGAMKSMNTFPRTDDLIASYSSKGPTTYDHVVKPDIVAPGNLVVSLDDHGSTLDNLYPGNEVAGNNTNHDYFSLSGTSMATPAAAGAVVLQLQQHPWMTPDQIKARLMKTAYKNFPTSSTATDPITGQTYTSYYDLFTIGAGYLDVQAALNNNNVAPGNVGAALSPTAVYNSSTGTVALSNGNSVIAGNSVVWGS